MKETMKSVSHQQARQLLHNKFIVVLGDSIQRSVYKDLVLLLQKDKYLTATQLKSKGEMSFELDCLVEGGCLSPMHNGIDYREVRQYQSAHHLVRFYFVTRIYSRYMQSVLEDFRHGVKPDVVIVNSCVWDISRYSSWLGDYRENLHNFFDELRDILPDESLVIWNLTMPLGKRLRGGFLVPEIQHKAPQLRQDVIEANFYSGTLADSFGLDVLDLHFHFRFSLQHRTKDGVHWNALAHRRITSMLLQHAAQAWGVALTGPLTTVDNNEVTDRLMSCGKSNKPAEICRKESASNYHYLPQADYFSSTERHPSKGHHDGNNEEFFSDAPAFSYLSFDENSPQQPQRHHRDAARASRPALSVLPHTHKQEQARNGFDDRPPRRLETHGDQRHYYVMRSRHTRRHYAPYTHHRPSHYSNHGSYY